MLYFPHDIFFLQNVPIMSKAALTDVFLQDMDDMDDALFGKKTSVAKKDTTAKASPKSK